MVQNYIYILSNQSLRKNFFKIGFTSDLPEKRAYHLSKSSSIPTDFKVEFSKKIDHKKIIETRIHLILNKYRINPKREFFNVEKKLAMSAVETAINYTETCEGMSETYYLHDDLIGLQESITLSATAHKILIMMICSTANNTFLDLLNKQKNIMKFGFISSIEYSKFFKKSIRSSCRDLNNFCKKYKHLSVYSCSKNKDIIVFYELAYEKCQCMWSFTNEFRSLFVNDKIIDS